MKKYFKSNYDCGNKKEIYENGTFYAYICCFWTGDFSTIRLSQHYINLSSPTMRNKDRLNMTLSRETEQTKCHPIASIKAIKEKMFHRIDTTPEKTVVIIKY